MNSLALTTMFSPIGAAGLGNYAMKFFLSFSPGTILAYRSLCGKLFLLFYLILVESEF